MKRALIWLVPLWLWFAPAQAQNVTVHVVPTCGAETLPTTPPAIAWLRMDQTGVLCTSGSGGGGGASNITQWATTALGAPTAYGTAPTTGNYIGVNAFVTNANTNGQKTMAASSPVTFASDQSTLNVLVTNGIATALSRVDIAPNNTTPVLVVTGATTLYDFQGGTINTSPVWLFIYDATSATCTSTTNLKRVWPVPKAGTATDAGGSNVALPVGATFVTGLTYCLSTSLTSAVAPAANTTVVNLGHNP